MKELSFERTYNIIEATCKWKRDTLMDILSSDFEKVVQDSGGEKYITVSYKLNNK